MVHVFRSATHTEQHWLTDNVLEMVENSSDVSIEQRLEAARKRFEELKKKKKFASFKAVGSESSEHNHETESTSPSVPSVLSSDNGEEVAELKSTIELQKNTIKKLRDENTNLKLERMDLQDKVTELEAKLARWRTAENTHPGINDTKSSCPVTQDVSPNETSSQPQTSTRYDSPINERENSTITDFRERLLAWKDWQVDMRSWNSHGGPLVTL